MEFGLQHYTSGREIDQDVSSVKSRVEVCLGLGGILTECPGRRRVKSRAGVPVLYSACYGFLF